MIYSDGENIEVFRLESYDEQYVECICIEDDDLTDIYFNVDCVYECETYNKFNMIKNMWWRIKNCAILLFTGKLDVDGLVDIEHSKLQCFYDWLGGKINNKK